MSVSRKIILPSLNGDIIRSFELDPLANLEVKREELERGLIERNTPFTYYDNIFIWDVEECRYCVSFTPEVNIVGVDFLAGAGRMSFIVSNVKAHAFGKGLIVAPHDLDVENTRKNFVRVLFP